MFKNSLSSWFLFIIALIYLIKNSFQLAPSELTIQNRLCNVIQYYASSNWRSGCPSLSFIFIGSTKKLRIDKQNDARLLTPFLQLKFKIFLAL